MEQTRFKIAIIGIGIAFVAGVIKCFLDFPIVEFYAFVGGPVVAYIVGRSYTDVKLTKPTE